MKKVIVLRKGGFYIYAYDLIERLAANNFEVTAILSIDKSEENVIYNDLLEKIHKLVKCIRVYDIPKVLFQKIKSILYRFNLSTNNLIVTPFLIYKTKRIVRHEKLDCIIAIGQESLYWAYHSFKDLRHKIIYYNLEIIYPGHPLTRADRTWARIVSFERKIISEICGLIIQDKFRASVLLEGVEQFQPSKIIYFPVCINEEIVLQKGDYLIKKFGISQKDFVILYFGGIWQGRFLEEVINQFSFLEENIKMVIHGGRGSFKIKSNKHNIIISEEELLFPEVKNLISSAHIGLAFYPTDNYNDKYTAYSSEKISRYCQCGIPFIAFENENYLDFKGKYDCCFLIQDLEQLNNAIYEVKSRYDYYKENAYKAFRNEFNYSEKIKHVISFVNDNC